MTLNDAWPTSFVAIVWVVSYIMTGNAVRARKAPIARVSIAGANEKGSLLYIPLLIVSWIYMRLYYNYVTCATNTSICKGAREIIYMYLLKDQGYQHPPIVA